MSVHQLPVGARKADAMPEPEDLLPAIVTELRIAESQAKRLREMLREQGRELAAKRRIAFIRDERLVEEFGA